MAQVTVQRPPKKMLNISRVIGYCSLRTPDLGRGLSSVITPIRPFVITKKPANEIALLPVARRPVSHIRKEAFIKLGTLSPNPWDLTLSRRNGRPRRAVSPSGPRTQKNAWPDHSSVGRFSGDHHWPLFR